MATVHVPVLAEQVVELLDVQLGQTVVDGTLGGGGHTRLLAQAVGGKGLVLALDRDPHAIEAGQAALAGLPVRLRQSNFAALPVILADEGLAAVDAILLDLGLSSDQLADDARGFSFQSAGPLDLRFDPREGRPAWQWIDELSEKDLANRIYEYGEERFSRRIARAIKSETPAGGEWTASGLAALIARVLPKGKARSRIHPATRTFQALRILANEELDSLERALQAFPDCLDPGGKLAVISFHSLEDRLVKWAFRDSPRWQVLTKRPLRPSEEEVSRNPRSRSAKLRVASAIG